LVINNINIIIKIEPENSNAINIAQSAIDPDNLADPPMTFYSKTTDNSLLITIKKVRKVETALATLMDLLSAIQTALRVIELIHFEN
jgi:hypothetical protein